jgi:two-component system, cell cycle response regulator
MHGPARESGRDHTSSPTDRMPEKALRSPLVLLASTSQWVARSLDSILRPAGFAVLRTLDGEQAVDQALMVRPDVLILDDRLPDISGAELCRRLLESGATDPTTPILITSQSAAGRDARLESLRAGAWDHLSFPLDAEELLLKLEVYLGAKRSADALRDIGLVDPVTGCYSARGLLRRAQELASEASRHERPLACVTIAPEPTTDPAPEVGGPPSDAVRQLGRLIDEETRESDSVGRIGRFEFVVLAPDTGVQGALRLAERLTSVATGGRVSGKGGRPFGLRAGCYAVANFRDAAIDPIELMTRSTLALRQSQTMTTAPRVHFFRADAVH